MPAGHARVRSKVHEAEAVLLEDKLKKGLHCGDGRPLPLRKMDLDEQHLNAREDCWLLAAHLCKSLQLAALTVDLKHAHGALRVAEPPHQTRERA